MKRSDFIRSVLALPFVPKALEAVAEAEAVAEKEYADDLMGRFLRRADEWEFEHGEYPAYFFASKKTVDALTDGLCRWGTGGSLQSIMVAGIRWVEAFASDGESVFGLFEFAGKVWGGSAT